VNIAENNCSPANRRKQYGLFLLCHQRPAMVTSIKNDLNVHLIIVKAKITMKTTDAGGRQSGFKSGYRPNHVFDLPVDLKNLKTFVGDILFDDQELIVPGENKIVTVRFLKMAEVEKYITLGRKWAISEAAKTVGFGEIVET